MASLGDIDDDGFPGQSIFVLTSILLFIVKVESVGLPDYLLLYLHDFDKAFLFITARQDSTMPTNVISP